MSAETPANAGTGSYLLMLLLGLAWAVVPLAAFTNFRGYRE